MPGKHRPAVTGVDQADTTGAARGMRSSVTVDGPQRIASTPSDRPLVAIRHRTAIGGPVQGVREASDTRSTAATTLGLAFGRH
jgi:hypothetical protein